MKIRHSLKSVKLRHKDCRIVRRKGEPEVNLRRAESWAVKARTLLRSPDIRASREVLTK